ncbi:hypothetical protein V6N11_061009 [Hibiscus sabdariffa]|uniref:DC1 domain-containing protein n=1 Tax=Hibiscus sabdariffa TaxID=183260 RepID=A0ABR2QRY6_9ROSI
MWCFYYRYVEKVEGKCCEVCGRKISDGAFACERCNACLHKSCYSCDFSLDVVCASSATAELTSDQKPLRSKDGKKKAIHHYSHGHELSFFKYRRMRNEDYDCFWCEKHLSGLCYGCVSCKFYLHPACSNKIPRRLAHPFHPGHPLRLSSVDGEMNYNACKRHVLVILSWGICARSAASALIWTVLNSCPH